MIEEKCLLSLPHSEYPIYIGHDIFCNQTILNHHIPGVHVLIVTQKNIPKKFLKKILNALQDRSCRVYVLKEGEKNKNIAQLTKIFSILLTQKFERNSTIIALGGGIVGDVAGLAAALYYRGINFIQMPTTLIAQTDSSVGGKTAVNYADFKNVIGTFYQPVCVINDIDFLMSLSQRDYVSGLAEVIKYSLIADKSFYLWMKQNIYLILQREKNALLKIITHSVKIKMEFVCKDEKDFGVRKQLNFGHTFGHALEKFCQKQKIKHGEAIAIGMCLALILSANKKYISLEAVDDVISLLTQAGLFNKKFKLPSDRKWLHLMSFDKKVEEGQLQFILLKAIGQACIEKNISPYDCEEALNEFSQRYL